MGSTSIAMRRADPGTLPASKGIGRMLASRRTVSVRRDPATRLARISRSVIGNCRAKDVPVLLGTRLKRPRKLVARSFNDSQAAHQSHPRRARSIVRDPAVDVGSSSP